VYGTGRLTRTRVEFAEQLAVDRGGCTFGSGCWYSVPCPGRGGSTRVFGKRLQVGPRIISRYMAFLDRWGLE